MNNNCLSLGALIFVVVSGSLAQAKCRVNMPKENWSKHHSHGTTQFICKNKSCGGSKYILRFGDNRLLGATPIFKGKSRLQFDGIKGLRIADHHGKTHDINETYFGPRRILTFYAAGSSKGQVAKNFRLLKSSAKCRR